MAGKKKYPVCDYFPLSRQIVSTYILFSNDGPGPNRYNFLQLREIRNDWETHMENELHQYFVKALDDLRRIAESKMKQERKNHTLTATALMNEAFLQFREPGEGLHDTDQFVGLVGHKMQQILHDHGRRKSARKRGGDWKRSNLDPKMLDPGDDRRKDIYSDPEMFLDACELIEQLALDYPQHAELVRHLLFTPGSTLAEAGEAVGWKYENAKKKLRFAISELRRRWSADD